MSNVQTPGNPQMQPENLPTLFGHPTALFTLFFAEMWERFSYYGMRALLVFYMIKGFLEYSDADAYRIYGAYAGMVYMTPFFGGMIADRLLGARRAVILGGFLMALGHLTMTIENEMFFFTALALLIVGNGFFKPNISTMVGSLYTEKDPRRDGGFTLFYMGINLGAALAPLLCGYVGETYGWHYGFGLATIGMMIGLAVFVVPTRIAQGLIIVGALGTAVAMVGVVEGALLLAVNGFVALALVISAVAAFMALGKGGLPVETGRPPDPAKLKEPLIPGIPLAKEYAVYIGAAVATPIFAVLVFSNKGFKVIPEWVFEPLTKSANIAANVAGTVLAEMSTLPGLILSITGLVATAYLIWESIRSPKIERQRLWVIVVLMFFSMLFWAFFEQGGSSMNNFTDRNVDRVQESWVVSQDTVGQTEEITVNQEQLGMVNGDPKMKQEIVKALRVLHADREQSDDATKRMMKQLKLEATIQSVSDEPKLTITGLDALREAEKLANKSEGETSEHAISTVVPWKFVEGNEGMGVEGSEIPASTYQSANAIFIVLFGLVFTGLWGFLGVRGREPSTPVKFGLGLLQLGLGFAALYYGATVGDARGMSHMGWLLLGYLLFTTGELCLSPVGLSMITKLSPKRLVSTAMGAWFLATAFSSLLASIIATFTGVGHGDSDSAEQLQTCATTHCADAGTADLATCAIEHCATLFGESSAAIPVPTETLHVYGNVFGVIAILIMVATLVMFALSPILTKWMHQGAVTAESEKKEA